MAGALKVEVTSERGALVFVDPDGARHVCQTPEDAWELLEDLALQVQEGGAELAKKKPEAEPKRRRSRRKVAQDRRAAESGHQSEAKTAANPEGLAHVEVGAVSRSRPNHEPPPSAEEPTDEPEEEFGAWERGFARIAHGVIKKGGEISSTSKFGRGGRFGRPKGT